MERNLVLDKMQQNLIPDKMPQNIFPAKMQWNSFPSLLLPVDSVEWGVVVWAQTEAFPAIAFHLVLQVHSNDIAHL